LYVLELVMLDGHRLLVNKSANESSLMDLALRLAAMRDRAVA